MKIAFLGPEASFTQLTATQLFPNEELIPKANILDCFLAVQNNEVDKAVVPLENSIEGTVSMTLDYLYQTPEIRVEAEAVMPIAHHLMIHPSQENDTDSTLNYFRTLIQLRKKEPTLIYGSYTLLDEEKEYNFEKYCWY